MRDQEEPTIDANGDEEHPAFGMVNINRVSSSHGASLFDSEIRHQHYVVVTLQTATRKRDLHRDWIHSRKQVVSFAMSEAQWAQAISSLNSSGTPVTIEWDNQRGYYPAIPHAPRLQISIDEAKGAAGRIFARAKEALAVAMDRPTKANLRAVAHALDAAEPNVTYAAKTLAEHAENTVAKAKADIEAIVDHRARQLGLDPQQLTLEVGGTKELES